MNLTNNMLELVENNKFAVFNWKHIKLGKIAKLFSGGTPNTQIKSYWNGNIPWLSSGETRNKYINKTEKKITELAIINSSTKLAKVGDVIIASAGQGTTRGQVSFCFIDTYINQSLIAVRPNEDLLDSKYLFFNLCNRYDELRGISDSHSSRGSLTTKLLSDLFIPLPPLEEQKAIAKILSSLDDKIELNRKMNETLESIAQAIFKRWFIDFEFPDENGNPYKSSGGEMVDSELGEIPKGWEVGKLGNYLLFAKGKKPIFISDEKVEGFQLHLLIDTLNTGKSNYANVEKMVIAEQKDMIMVMDGASSGRVEIGFEGVVGSTLAKIGVKTSRMENSFSFTFLNKNKKI